MADDSRRASSTEAADRGSASAASAENERAPNTLLNALIGGVVGVVFSFIPFSTVLGGGVAGYLEGGDTTSGAKVGALAGLVTFVPLVFIVLVLLAVMPVMSGPASGFGVQLALWVSVLFVLLVVAVYTVGLSLVGGILGVYVKEEI